MAISLPQPFSATQHGHFAPTAILSHTTCPFRSLSHSQPHNTAILPTQLSSATQHTHLTHNTTQIKHINYARTRITVHTYTSRMMKTNYQPNYQHSSRHRPKKQYYYKRRRPTTPLTTPSTWTTRISHIRSRNPRRSSHDPRRSDRNLRRSHHHLNQCRRWTATRPARQSKHSI